MKKRGKMKVRWMSALLCMSMLLSNIPITAGAEGELQEVIETETEVMTEMAAEVETEAVMETEPTIETEVVTEAALETETEAETEYMTETETETETEIETETEAESNLEIEETVEEEVNENAAEPEKIQVDFMEYLDPVIPMLFQSTTDINVREYLVNAFGIPEEIPFVCEPAVVSFGQYADGDILPITITAKDDYSGAAAVTAEVYHIAPAVLCRVVTVNLKIKQGNNEIASTTIAPSRDFNSTGSYGQVADLTWSPEALQANTDYTLEVSWGAPYAEGYDSGNGRCGIINMWATGEFVEGNVRRSLGVTNSGLNTYDTSGTATCTFKTDSYGVYTIKTAMNHQAGAGERYIDIKLVFQDSGKEADSEKTVPSGSNITMSTTTNFAESKYEFTWTKNGVTIDGANGSSYTAPTATAGEKYVATIKRKADSRTGCTGTESWTQTFTVSEQQRIAPQGKTAAYTGSKIPLEYLVDVGYAGEGFFWAIPVGDFGFMNSLENYWTTYCDKNINVGTYTLDYYLATDFLKGSKAGTITYTIAPANPTLDIVPTAITGLKYDGTPKALINAGSATNGTMQYSLDGKSWSADIPTVKEGGSHTVYYRVKGANKNYKDLTSDSYKLTVTIAPVIDNVITNVSASENLIYNGAAQTLLTAEAKYGNVSYALGTNDQTAPSEFSEDIPVAVNAGTYYVWYCVKENSSYNAVVPVCQIVNIAPKEVTAELDNLNKIYDGSENADNVHIVLNGVAGTDYAAAKADTITYDDANAGERTVTAVNIRLTGENASNYKLKDGNVQGVLAVMTATGVIQPHPITIQPIDGQKKIYGEQDPELLNWEVKEENGLVDGDTLTGITASREAGENAGSYVITLTMKNGENPNYAITAETGSFVIEKKDLTVGMTVKKQFDNATAVDKGKDTFVTVVNGIVGADQVILNSDAVEASFAFQTVGKEIAVNLNGEFTLEGDESILANYNLVQPTDVTGEIYNHFTADITVIPQGWTNSTVKVYAPADSKVSMNYELWSDTLELIDIAEDKEGNTYTVYVKNSDGDISLPMNVTTFIETTVPTGTITLAEKSWVELLGSFSFDQFFKRMQTVRIEAKDNLSGIKSIEYYESDKALSQAEVEAITQWQLYNGAIDVTLEDAKKFIYFAKLTDNAGNITYLSTDGAVYDTTAPVIEGVEAKEYCTTQVITVTDTNLDTVTLNGEMVTSSLTLAGNTEAVYTIVATDKAGNSSTVTVTMKTLAAVDDTIEELNSVNVTSDQKEEVQSVLDKANELLQDEDTTEEEKKQLEDLKAGAEELLETLQKAEDAVSSEEIKKVENVDSSNVQLEDEEDLQKAKDALENALKENGANYTEEEKKEIQEEINRIDEVITSIEKTEEVIADIMNLPEEMETDLSEEEEQALLDSKAAYDALTEHEKSLVSEELLEKLNALLEVLVDYQIIEGNGTQWIKGSGKKLTFVANGPYRKFAFIEVDGKEVDADLYTTEEGSTVVNLKASYLEKLSEGKHKITVYYADGEAEGTFKVLSAAQEDTEGTTDSGANGTTDTTGTVGGASVATGDTTNILLWVSLMCLSVLSLAGVFVKKRMTK